MLMHWNLNKNLKKEKWPSLASFYGGQHGGGRINMMEDGISKAHVMAPEQSRQTPEAFMKVVTRSQVIIEKSSASNSLKIDMRQNSSSLKYIEKEKSGMAYQTELPRETEPTVYTYILTCFFTMKYMYVRYIYICVCVIYICISPVYIYSPTGSVSLDNPNTI